jgi:hypothetical protein
MKLQDPDGEGLMKWSGPHNAVASPPAMKLEVIPSLYPYRSTALEENT